MKVLISLGTLTPTEGKVDKDLPKPLKYSLAFCLYGIIGFIIYKVIIIVISQFLVSSIKDKMVNWGLSLFLIFNIFEG